MWLIDANLTMGSAQSEDVGSYHPEMESEAGAEFHSLLTTWDMTFYQPLSTMTPQGQELDVPIQEYATGMIVVLSRKHLPTVASAGVDTRIQIDINFPC